MTAPHLKIASEANAIAMNVKAGVPDQILKAMALTDRAWDEIGANHALTFAIGSFAVRASAAKRDAGRVRELADELQRAVLTVLQAGPVGADRVDIHG
jgi:hypothetical protein